MKTQDSRNERLERLAERWLSGAASDAEERELRDALRTAEALPPSLEEYRLLFEGLGALSQERMPRTVDAAAFSSEGRPPQAGMRSGERPTLRRRLVGWSSALAAAAAVAIGIYIGVDRLREPYCYIDGVAIYDREVAMQATAYFDSFAALDAPTRLVDELLETE